MSQAFRKFSPSAVLGLGLGAALAGTLGLVACAELDQDESLAGGESVVATAGESLSTGARPKYVFLFIGDGMASVQIHAAEAYLANKAAHDDVGGTQKAQLLTMSQLPVQGMQMTFPWNSLITDSAPAATAMATGKKTADGVIAMDP